MNKKLTLRLWTSVLLLLIFLFCSFLLFRSIQTSRKEQGAPAVLRSSFLINEKLWSGLQSSKRLSVEKPIPSKFKTPRVNGLLGLGSPIDSNTYEVSVVTGEAQTIKVPLHAFKLLPKHSYSTDFRCIEGWSEEMQYAGVRFSDFLEAYNLGKKKDGTYYAYVGLETPDRKYYVSLDMESMLHPQTILAYEMNLQILSLQNGAPLRLVIPIKYGIKSLKRVGKIFFSDTRPPDYWAERGYDWYSGL